MNKYSRKYSRIVDKLITESFRELKEAKIRIVEFPEFFSFWSFAEKSFSGFFIFINKSQRNLDAISLKGEFAHELCHIILDHRNKSLLGDLFHNFRKFLSFIFNTKFSREIESKIDKEVIKRGYAKELIADHKSWNKFLSKENVENLYTRGYLSPKEIKSYARSIGRW